MILLIWNKLTAEREKKSLNKKFSQDLQGYLKFVKFMFESTTFRLFICLLAELTRYLLFVVTSLTTLTKSEMNSWRAQSTVSFGRV